MHKIKISLATIGQMPLDFNRQKIKKFKSKVFEITGDIESYSLNRDSDGSSWEFSDSALENVLPNKFNGDFLIGIVNVPIELNYYSRRLSANRVVLSFHEIKDYLRQANIPLENIIYRILYAHALLYKRSEHRIPETKEKTKFTHDETRGCLFDMNGIKTDLINSCHKPVICTDCVQRLRGEKVSEELISQCQSEISRIRKTMFYRIMDFIKLHPLWSLTISSFAAIFLGAIGSLMASWIWVYLTSK